MKLFMFDLLYPTENRNDRLSLLYLWNVHIQMHICYKNGWTSILRVFRLVAEFLKKGSGGTEC